MIVTISEYLTNPPLQLSATDELEIRGWYNRDFIAGDGITPVEANFTNGQSGPYYLTFPTLTATGLLVPAHDVQATTESNPTAGYIEQLWVNGALVDVLMPNTAVATGWAIPTVYGPVIAFDEIATYNRAKRLVFPPSTYFTADQTIQEINRIAGTLSYAGLNILGRTQLSTAPADPAHPIAVGDNDPRLLQLTDVVTPFQFGAIADGSSHPLSTVYGSLAAAQAAYSGAYYFVTSLAQEIDYAAVKAASNACFGEDLLIGSYITPSGASTTSLIIDTTANYPVNSLANKVLFMRYPNGFIDSTIIASNTATTITLSPALPIDFHPCPGQVCTAACAQAPQAFPCSQYAVGVGEHGLVNAAMNKALSLQSGVYMFGADTWTIRNLVGGYIYGTERFSTILKGSGCVLRTDGLWYTTLRDFSCQRTSGTAGQVIDLDGNVPGHAYATRSVQGNTLIDIQWNGTSGTAAGTVGLAWCRQGGASAQGESEMINCYGSSCETIMTILGANALGFKMERGDFQDYVTGVSLTGGWLNIDTTTFESLHPYEQAINGGFDISCGTFGVGERMIFSGIRTESLQFYKGSGTQPSILEGIEQLVGGITAWGAFGNYTLHQVILTTIVVLGVSRVHAYYVSQAGTAGAVEPIWPATGAIADGSVVWTEMPFRSVDTTTIFGAESANTINILNSGFAGPVSIGGFTYDNLFLNTFTASLTMTLIDWGIYPKRLDMFDATAGSITLTMGRAPIGMVTTLKRVDATGNTVTINFIGGATVDGLTTLSLLSNDAVTIVYAANNVWYVVGRT